MCRFIRHNAITENIIVFFYWLLLCLLESNSHLASCDSMICIVICSEVHQTFWYYISNNVCFFFFLCISWTSAWNIVHVVIVWYMRHCLIAMHFKLQHRNCQLKILMNFWGKQHFSPATDSINSNRIWIIIDTEEWIRFWSEWNFNCELDRLNDHQKSI